MCVGEWKEDTKTLIGAFHDYMNMPKSFMLMSTRIMKILVECIENPYTNKQYTVTEHDGPSFEM